MVFNSLTFLLFFAVVLLMHSLPMSWTIKKINLLIASYLFYAAWNPPFVLLLVLSAVVDFFLALCMERTERSLFRRLCLILSLVLNLGLLGFFKYANFAVATFAEILKSLGVSYRPPAFDIILPLGISFYTFETISYLIDVYRRKIPACRSFLDYALFLTFFPHLVAGPIVRPADFLPQCRRPRQATADQLGWGLSLLVLGLFEKMILADAVLAPIADRVFDAAAKPGYPGTFSDSWLGTLAFSGQILFDFAGYSACGIGVALSLGFVLNDNFRFPYGAIGFSDFWQRWHITLSSWLRDYLYIPLGGNRNGAMNTYRNLIITMLLGGLWHGASWRFVAWGGLHGLFLAAERKAKAWLGDAPLLMSIRGLPIVLSLLTYGLVCVTWVFFRATSFTAAFRMLRVMALPSTRVLLLTAPQVGLVVTVIAALLFVHWELRASSLEQAVARLPWRLRAAGLAGLIVSLLLTPGDERAFIYFQF